MDNKQENSQEIKSGIINWAVKGVLYKAYAAVVLMLFAIRDMLALFYSPLAFPSFWRPGGR